MDKRIILNHNHPKHTNLKSLQNGVVTASNVN